MYTDEKLLEAAAQLSSEESSEEGEKGDGETSKSRVQQPKRKSKSHKSHARDAHLRPRDRKEHSRSKDKKTGGRRKDWLATAEKERRKLVEAEARAGQKNRLQRGLLLPPGSDELRFEVDSMGDYGNLAFGCPSLETVPKYSKGLQKKQEKNRQAKQHKMHVRRSDKVGFGDNEEFVGFFRGLNTRDTIRDDLDAPTWSTLDEDEIIKETRRFNVETREDPHNIDLWLEFANFQENMVRFLKKKGSKVKLNALQKKISVLERGLSFNPDSDQLMLELLECAERSRPPEEMEERWNKAVSYLHSSVDMWRAYVSRQRENRSSFDAMYVSQSYHSAILAMYRSYKMAETDNYAEQKFQLAKDLVDITLECIQYHFECNMTEYAVSMIQAWFEYQYLSPKDWPEDAIEAMFQEFWNSGAPLIGQEGGEGWGMWLDSCQNAVGNPKNGRNQKAKQDIGVDRLISGPWDHVSKSLEDEKNDSALDTMDDSTTIRLSKQDDLEKQFAAEFDALMDRVEENPSLEILNTWIQMEDEKDSMHFLRASTVRSDQEQENASLESDPSEKVDWHEILHCLMRIDQPESAQYSLLMGCLELLGVIRDPVPHCNVSLSDDLSLLDYCSTETGCPPSTWKHWSWESLLPGTPGRSNPWWTKSLNRQTFCIRLLLTISSCFQGPLQSILLSAAIVLASSDVSTTSSEHSSLTLISSAKDESIVKDMLSRYSSMLSLWGMYAFLKAASGSFKMSKKVFRNCIKSNASMWDMGSIYDRAQICIFQAKSEILSTAIKHDDLLSQYPYSLLNLKKEQALNIITSHVWFASRGTTLIDNLSDVVIVETRKKFQNLLSDLCRLGSQLPSFKTNLICTLEVAASFELLVPIARSESIGILSAVHMYQHILSEVDEMLTDARTIDDPLSFDMSIQQQCNLAVFTSHSFPLLLSPGVARALTLEALTLWPGHPAFLRILSIHEERSCNLNSLRREIGILVARSHHTPIMEYLFLIVAEMKSGSSPSSISLLIERALQHTSCRACPLFWRLRLRLASQLDTQRQPLMNIFLRSIDACPWSKSVWMDGIDALHQSAQFSCKEIMNLVDVMRYVHA